jgi:hypothetical protein
MMQTLSTLIDYAGSILGNDLIPDTQTLQEDLRARLSRASTQLAKFENC